MSRTSLVPKEHPMLFSTDMVRAIREGRKTVTRRKIKRQDMKRIRWNNLLSYGRFGWECDHGRHIPWSIAKDDMLWVRETWASSKALDHIKPSDLSDGFPCEYAAGGCSVYGYENLVSRGKWRQSIFMPRHASRILLHVTDVRPERLQDITEVDAIREGIIAVTDDSLSYDPDPKFTHEVWGELEDTAVESFKVLWDSLNDKKGYGWDANPWVWRIEFDVVKGLIHG